MSGRMAAGVAVVVVQQVWKETRGTRPKLIGLEKAGMLHWSKFADILPILKSCTAPHAIPHSGLLNWGGAYTRCVVVINGSVRSTLSTITLKFDAELAPLALMLGCSTTGYVGVDAVRRSQTERRLITNLRVRREFELEVAVEVKGQET